MTTTVIEGLHNGIASYSMTGEGICTGTLMFGVGFRNEPATLAGVTHLVEHLVLRMVHPMPMYHGGKVDVDSVEFHASGEAAEVAGYLNAIAAAIVGFSEVSEESLTLEKSVLEAEDPAAFARASSGLLTYRFGTNGLGAGHFGAPASTGLSRDETIAWVRQWFTAGNAAVTFTAALPSSLDIRLPPGAAIDRGPDEALITTPTVIRSAKAGVALSFIVPPDNAPLLGEAVRYELLDRLSHTGGLIYSVDIITTVIDAGHCQLDLILDPVDRNVPAVFTGAVTAIRDVAATGLGTDAVRSARNAMQAEMGWQGNIPTFDYMYRRAVDQLLGRTTLTPQEWLARAAAITPSDLTAVLAASMRSLIVAVDRDAKVRKGDVKALNLALDPFDIWQRQAAGPQEPQGAHQAWRHKRSKTVMWFSATHLLKRESGKTKSIALADVAVVGNRNCGCISLLDRRGRTAELSMDDWRQGKKLRKALLSAFPAEVIRTFPED
jgi:hypothetical protein